MFEHIDKNINCMLFTGENRNVKKFVFSNDEVIYESVVYKYPEYKERTVICCSVQSGCPVGCVFCGTGKKFVRNLTADEIVHQIKKVLIKERIDLLAKNNEISKFQIMFMSMGEPMLNWDNVQKAIKELHVLYPNAQLLISTMGVNDNNVMYDLIFLANEIKQVGLQYSLHNSIEEERNKLIPFKNKYPINEMLAMLKAFYRKTGRKPYINYCVTKENSTEKHINELMRLCNPNEVCLTFSVVCNINKEKTEDETDYTALFNMQSKFLDAGYNVRVFDPAGKDDIGGGCGQLWYVQEWLKDYDKSKCHKE